MDWLLLLVILGLRLGPDWLFNSVMKNYGEHRPDLPLNGQQVARKLLDHADLKDVPIVTDNSDEYTDSYDSDKRVVSLSARVASAHSIAAYAAAAHEVGHAIQFARQETWLRWDDGLTRLFSYGQWILVAALFIFIFASWFKFEFATTEFWRSYGILVILAFVGCGFVVRLLALPLEMDASFGSALPLLEQGRFLHGKDLESATTVLSAAALTYGAFAALGLLSLVLIAYDRLG